MSDAQSGGIKLEIGFFFSGYPDTQLYLTLDMLSVVLHFVKIVANRKYVVEAIVDQVNNLLKVIFRFEPITDNGDVLGEFFFSCTGCG